MPFETGFVPSDGFRHYYRGYTEKMEFRPCGHVLEDCYDADSKHHTHPHYHQFMEEIREQMMFNSMQIKQIALRPPEVDKMLMNKIQCVFCETKTEEVRFTYNNNVEEVSESKFRAYRAMGWV